MLGQSGEVTLCGRRSHCDRNVALGPVIVRGNRFDVLVKRRRDLSVDDEWRSRPLTENLW